MLKLLVLLLTALSLTSAHMVLTYPPARKYAFDFLDNSRTQLPCGVTRGYGPNTSFKGGTNVTVTWHLAYPHQGGFYLEILNPNNFPVMRYALDPAKNIAGPDPTREPGHEPEPTKEPGHEPEPTKEPSHEPEPTKEPGHEPEPTQEPEPEGELIGFFGYHDPTMQKYTITLPDMDCDKCTLRLVRQALEWGVCSRQYLFHSCADITITRGDSDPRHDCSGHGSWMNGKCTCDRLYEGEYCQYKDECMSYHDCNSKGMCVYTGSTYYPKRQCYCDIGYFGRQCEKESKVKNSHIDFSLYQKRNMREGYDIFYRTIPGDDELEVVMMAKTTTWVALGWKPTNYMSMCQLFPKLAGVPNPSTGAPEPEPTKEPGAEPTKEPGAEPTKEPGAEPTTEPGAEPTTEPGAEPTKEPGAEPTKEPGSKPVPRGLPPCNLTVGGTVPGPEPEPESEGTPEPEPAGGRRKRHSHGDGDHGAGTGEPEPTPESNGEPEPEPNSNGNRVGIPNGSGPERPTDGVRTHPMDCSDIVIGTARGMRSRIGDYYTRDRSTPQLDEFYGGTNDLTAALGYEMNGYTVILFRKPLKANSPSDHDIPNALTTVIWAVGQEMGNYIHSPNSGIEIGKASIPSYYHADELKYHGHSPNRGAASLNFFEKVAEEGGCKGQYPLQCNGCDYKAEWSIDKVNTKFDFKVSARADPNAWLGIGFSDNGQMIGSKAVIGWADGNNTYVGMRQLGSKSPNGIGKITDSDATLGSKSIKVVDGRTEMEFTLSSLDAGTEDNCVFLLFPTKGGSYNHAMESIGQHPVTPSRSSEMVCFSFNCDQLASRPMFESYVSIRFIHLPFLNQYANKKSPEFMTFSAKLVQWLNSRKPMYLTKIEVVNIRSGSVIVDFLVTTTQSDNSVNSNQNHNNQVRGFFESILKEGTVAGERVDPKYLQITGEDDHHGIKLTLLEKIIIGVSVAFCVVGIIVCICKIQEARSMKPSLSTEKLANGSNGKQEAFTESVATRSNGSRMTYDQFLHSVAMDKRGTHNDGYTPDRYDNKMYNVYVP